MKKIICLLLTFLFCMSFTGCSDEINPLDEILEYHITINPNREGNLNMEYHIKWKVLNSKSEGPLEWVKIGVPNKYVKNITALSEAIDEISYYSDDGAYIRVDLDKAYYAGEVVDIDFSFVQTHIYTLNEEEVVYRFNPGWFPEIQVKDLKVYWAKDKVTYSNSTLTNEDYYIWSYSLDYNETIDVDVKYNKESFINLSNDNTFSDDYEDWSGLIVVFVFIGVFVLVCLIIAFVAYKNDDGYYSYRGFSGCYHHHYWWLYRYRRGVNRRGESIKDPRVVNRTGGSSRGGSCACACACACAGGGRAGCSRKDFYNPNLKIDEFLKINQE